MDLSMLPFSAGWHLALLHGFVVKTRKTQQAGIDRAIERMKEVT